MYGIKEARQEVYDTISQFTDKKANKKPDDNTWSVLQNLEHLYLTEKAMTAMVKEALQLNERIAAPEEKPIQLTLDRSNKVDAPDFVQPKGAFTSLTIAKEKLNESRQKLIKLLQSYEESDLLNNSAKHPIFGTTSIAQLIEFIGLHEKRHLNQIKELEQLL